jgi:hypothetical protein
MMTYTKISVNVSEFILKHHKSLKVVYQRLFETPIHIQRWENSDNRRLPFVPVDEGFIKY